MFDFGKAFRDAQTEIRSINNNRPLGMQQFGQMVADGGPLALQNAAYSPINMQGLSPDEFLKLQTGRIDPMSQISAVGKVADQVTGAPELRKSLSDLVSAKLAATVAQGSQQDQFAHADTNQERLFGQQDKIQASTQAGEDGRLSKTLAAKATESAADRVSREKQHAETIGVQRAHLDLESRRLKYLQSQAAGQGIGTGTTPDPAGAAEYDKQLKQYGFLDKNGKYQPEEMPPNVRKAAWSVYMQREAAKGLPFASVYDAPPNVSKDLGYSKLVLGPDGWHGVYPDPKNPKRNEVTPGVVVPYKSKPANVKGAGAVSVGPTYANE